MPTWPTNWAAATGRTARSCGGCGSAAAGSCRSASAAFRGRSTNWCGASPRIETFFAHELAARWDELLRLLARLEGPVYLSFDVDGLDPSIIPSTGTPQPNGLTWPQAMEVIRAVIHAPCDLMGADVVEFIGSSINCRTPPPGCDLNAARLVMKILAYWAQRT